MLNDFFRYLYLVNVLRAAFMSTEPKSVKRQSSQQCHFTLLRPTIVKTARKILMKLTPGICICAHCKSVVTLDILTQNI